MSNIKDLVTKMETVWPGTLGDDIDVKEIEKNLKVLEILTPIIQTMQAQKLSDGTVLLQQTSMVPIKESEFEIVCDYILRSINQDRPDAEVVEKEEKKDDE